MSGERTASDLENGEVGLRDLELIAALIDRRLSDAERREVLARLDREEALYDVFVETVRCREEISRGSAEVVEHPASRNRWAVPAAIAAVLALAVVTPRVYRGITGAGYAETLVAGGELGPALGEGWYEQGWSTLRGVQPGVEGAEAAFRVGVRVVDLETALRLERDQDAMTLAARTRFLLRPVEGMEPLGALYEQIGDLLAAGDGRVEALETAETAESILPDFLQGSLSDAFDLGRWAEAGRLAARSGNTRLLRSRSFRRTLRELGKAEWDPKITPHLEALSRMLQEPAARMDLARLQEIFAAIIAES